MGKAMGVRLLPLVINILTQAAVYGLSEGQNAKSRISLGSTLSTNSKWVSQSGDFAFGLYRIAPNRYLLGVWLEKIQGRTLVWTANRDDPVDEGSTVALTEDGHLVLYDSGRAPRWSADGSRAPGPATVGAAMLDTGNFVLLDASSNPTWQSFDSPTDTLLPGQSLRWKSVLVSRAADGDYSSGRFELHLQEDGNLVLYPLDRQDQPRGAYWSSNTWKSEANPMRLIFDRSGLLSLVNATNTTVLVLNEGYASQSYNSRRLRVTLDSDGILREYVAKSKAGWSVAWQVIDNPCKVKSACGINTYCILTDEGKPDCECVPGFDFVDVKNRFKGCVRNVTPSCDASSTMVEIDHADWLADADYSFVSSLNVTQCQQTCLDDCQCVVVIYGIGNCWKKTSPLLDGRQGLDIDRIAFVKVPNNMHM